MTDNRDELLAQATKALEMAERCIDDCQSYRSHDHYVELAAIRGVIMQLHGFLPLHETAP